MNDYNLNLPVEPTFTQKGLSGYKYHLRNPDLEVFYVDVVQGHDTYEISKKCTHIYFVIEGEGFFEIDGSKLEAKPQMVIEVPPEVEYSYTGKMKLLLIMNPPFFEGNGEVTRMNQNVV